jgi:hypothetical protein
MPSAARAAVRSDSGFWTGGTGLGGKLSHEKPPGQICSNFERHHSTKRKSALGSATKPEGRGSQGESSSVV